VTTFLLDSNLPGGGDYDPADLVWTERAEQHRYLARQVAPGASIVASRRFLGNVADRAELYVFPPSYAGKLWPPERRSQVFLLDLTNDNTLEALQGRQSPLRANRPYAIWLAGPEAMMLTDRVPEPWFTHDFDVGEMRLHGFDSRWNGKVVEIELHWQVTAKPSSVLTRTLKVSDSRGSVAGVLKGTVLDDLYPAPLWQPGQVIVDRVRFDTNDIFPDRMLVGWQRPDGTGETLELSLGLTR
jgi:hypothetical protein